MSNTCFGMDSREEEGEDMGRGREKGRPWLTPTVLFQAYAPLEWQSPSVTKKLACCSCFYLWESLYFQLWNILLSRAFPTQPSQVSLVPGGGPQRPWLPWDMETSDQTPPQARLWPSCASYRESLSWPCPLLLLTTASPLATSPWSSRKQLLDSVRLWRNLPRI